MVSVAEPGWGWDSGDTFASQVSLREGQTRTFRVTLSTEGDVDSGLFIDLEVQRARGEPVLFSSLGWPDHVENQHETTTGEGQFVTLQVDDALRACRGAADTGWSPPAETVDGACQTSVDLVLLLEGEGNVVLFANPTLSTPWDQDAAAWISGFAEVE